MGKIDVMIDTYPRRPLNLFIGLRNERNSDLRYGSELIEGVNSSGEFIRTKACLDGIDLTPYKVVKQGDFVYNPSRLNIGSLSYRRQSNFCIVSHLYVVFYITKEGANYLLPEFLLTYFRRTEFLRMVEYFNFGSQRAEFNFHDIGEFLVPLPPIEVQRAYVAAYKGLSDLIEQNEALVKELEAAAQAEVARCRQEYQLIELRNFILRLDERNTQNSRNVKGLSISKQFREPSSKVNYGNLLGYKVVHPGEFAFVQTTHNEKCLVVCHSSFTEDIVVSPVHEVFKLKTETVLLPEFLFLQFKRAEIDRYARFNSWGSARETFNWEDMCRVKIPLPPIEVQRAIVALYHCAEEARKIAQEARETLAKACPAMIQSAAHHFLPKGELNGNPTELECR